MLYGLNPHDPVTLIAAILALTAVALLAGFLPAQRAAAVNPMIVLREE
jgi:ABC-type antimicrobial peptide transport system permease subunit